MSGQTTAPILPYDPARGSTRRLPTSSGEIPGGISYENDAWQTRDDLTLEGVIETVRERGPGVKIMFLSSLQDGNTDLPQQTKDEICTEFGVLDFFWTRTGYDANGFFHVNESPLPDLPDASYGTSSRFLIKEINAETPAEPAGSKSLERGKPKIPRVTYKWQFLSFISLWYKAIEQDDPTQILLCFDLSPEMKGLIKEKFEKSDPKTWRGCPLGLYTVIVPFVVHRFDDALWKFQPPIRTIEKSRNTQSSFADYQRHYINMHEFSRHIIHKMETIQVAARTVASIAEHHEQARAMHVTSTPGTSGRVCRPNFVFFSRVLENLQSRAVAFNNRLDNEIKLASNLSTTEDNALSQDLTNLVSTATLLFLPGSFISSLFGMNFFDFGPDKISTSNQIYIFVVVTVVVTLGAYVVWVLYSKRNRKNALTGLQPEWMRSSDSDRPLLALPHQEV